MFSILLYGFLIGLRHAIEADHVMAVASLVSDKNPRRVVWQGVAWGLGHTLTLLVVGGVVIYAASLIPTEVANVLELIVGVMLLVLGADLIRKVVKNRWHIHVHKHANGLRHNHVHSHTVKVAHEAPWHDHFHSRDLPVRALLVGMMHGLAGSAALVLLALQAVKSPLMGFFYLIIFGIGSIVGMALLSTCIAVPMKHPLLKTGQIRNGLSGIIGISTLLLGAYTIYDIGFSGGVLFG
jgi:high-affinity nickel permease